MESSANLGLKVDMKPISSKTFWQTWFGVGFSLSGLAAFVQTFVRVSAMDVSLWHSKWTLLFLACLVTIGISAFLFYTLQVGKMGNFFQRLDNIKFNAVWRVLAFLLLLALAFVPPFVKLVVFGKTLPGFFPLFWVFWWISLLQILLWKGSTSSSWAGSFASVVLLLAVFHEYMRT